MKKVSMFILFTITVFCLQGSHSQVSVQTEPEKFKVAVYVSENNDDTESEKTLKNLLRSYIKRELRSLGDVEVVDYDLDRATFQYRIRIAMLELNTGLVAMSIVHAKRIPPNRFNGIWRAYYTKYPAYEKTNGSVMTVGRTRLDEVYKGIVADFDTEILEPERLLR